MKQGIVRKGEIREEGEGREREKEKDQGRRGKGEEMGMGREWQEREGREGKEARKMNTASLFVVKINGVNPLLGKWSRCIFPYSSCPVQ